MTRINIKNEKIIAWGASKLLDFYLSYSGNSNIKYIIDSNKKNQGKKINGIVVKSPSALLKEKSGQKLVIFAVSNLSIQHILNDLHEFGFLLNKNVFLYGDLFYRGFEKKLERILSRSIENCNYNFVKSFSLASRVPIHTTLLGNLLFLELLVNTIKKDPNAAIAEIGAFCGGNSLMALFFLANQAKKPPFYIFDSFEGFPNLSKSDPVDKRKGDYKSELSFESVLDIFSAFDNARVIKGFVPKSFTKLNKNMKYGLVFYDCDLYEPALVSFDYFWKKIIPGGYLLIHDYIAQKGGYEGVKKATDEYFKNKKVEIHTFWENTMALIIKK